MTDFRYILGIESSCDDTAAAVLDWQDGAARVRASVVQNQNNLHEAFGGVVPEIAARAHAERLDSATAQALGDAGLTLGDIDAIAVTAGPGLIGGVLSGVMFAKGLALTRGVPFIGVNHLAGHALTPRMTDDLPFPYLLLLVSGGHCQFLIVENDHTFHRIGGTIDDAPGEAFDKIARVLGLPQPGGPSIEALAKKGDPERIPLPRPLLDKPGCDMSFSGLKTAVIRARDDLMTSEGALTSQDQADLAAAFQAAVVDVLTEKTRRAIDLYLGTFAQHPKTQPAFAVAGGVAANQALGSGLRALCADHGLLFAAPPIRYCTDNAAMIAYAGGCALQRGESSDFTLSARPRWPLDQNRAPMLGSGKKGAKA